MSGITFMVDERGQKTAAVIDLRKHEQLWEDFYDAALARARSREPRASLTAVRRRLLRNGKLRISAIRHRSDAYR